MEQADAQLALVGGQIARAALTAPLDGVVIQGDLSRSLGAPVARGEVLFEVAPLEDFRLSVQVAEGDIWAVEQGQPGEIVLSAFPGEPLSFVVRRVGGVAEGATGRVVFDVEASIDTGMRLRPGMSGIAKIQCGRRTLLQLAWSDIAGRLQLAAWRYLP